MANQGKNNSAVCQRNLVVNPRLLESDLTPIGSFFRGGFVVLQDGFYLGPFSGNRSYTQKPAESTQ